MAAAGKLVDLRRQRRGPPTHRWRPSRRASRGVSRCLLFLNRRGFAPTLICRDCGHIAECDRCDSRMTVHARRTGCVAITAAHDARWTICSECGDATIEPFGEGTERVEEAVAERFPGARHAHRPRQGASAKGMIDEALERVHAGDLRRPRRHPDAVQGTPFPELTLVGIVNADQGLFGTDFRSAERMAQLLVQVAGRAGRGARRRGAHPDPFPEHPFWSAADSRAATSAVAERCARRSASRRAGRRSRLALLRAESAHRPIRHTSSSRLAAGASARRLAAAQVRVLGPVDAPMERRAGRYRAQLLLESASRRQSARGAARYRPALRGQSRRHAGYAGRSTSTRRTVLTTIAGGLSFECAPTPAGYAGNLPKRATIGGFVRSPQRPRIREDHSTALVASAWTDAAVRRG